MLWVQIKVPQVMKINAEPTPTASIIALMLLWDIKLNFLSHCNVTETFDESFAVCISLLMLLYAMWLVKLLSFK